MAKDGDLGLGSLRPDRMHYFRRAQGQAVVRRADVEEYLYVVVPGHEIWSSVEGLLGWNIEDKKPRF